MKARNSRRAAAVVLALAGLVLVAVGIAGVDFGDNGSSRTLVPGGPARSGGEFDPLAYRPILDDAFARRAAGGYAHVLYAKSPGGVLATAARVARFRPRIESAARRAGVDADELEALVFLESAGRPQAVAGAYPAGAVGLTQILGETGRSLLSMHIDAGAARRTAAAIAVQRRGLAADRREAAGIRTRARARGVIRIPVARRLVALDRAIPRREAALRALRARRLAADDRLDPAKALAGTGRYLQLGRLRFGRPDLALVSYHMGIGNLERVIRAYTGDTSTPVGKLVQRKHLSYTRLFFDSTPLRHGAAQRILFGLGDDSADYLWRVRAAQEIMRMWRSDRAGLRRTAALQTAKNSAEEVLHPRSSTRVYLTPEQLVAATRSGVLVRFEGAPRQRGYARSARMGELASKVGARPRDYRALRPEALAALRYIAAGVRAISHRRAPILVTSTARDVRYQRALIPRNPEATQRYSLHTTGYAFDVRRSYASPAQALAFQYMLDRLQALGLIAWVREPAAIHVTVASEARELEGVTGVKR